MGAFYCPYICIRWSPFSIHAIWISAIWYPRFKDFLGFFCHLDFLLVSFCFNQFLLLLRIPILWFSQYRPVYFWNHYPLTIWMLYLCAIYFFLRLKITPFLFYKFIIYEKQRADNSWWSRWCVILYILLIRINYLTLMWRPQLRRHSQPPES